MVTEIQRLAAIAMDFRSIGAIHTEIGWVWRSDVLVSVDAALGVALAILDDPTTIATIGCDQIKSEDVSKAQMIRNFDFSSEIKALNNEIAGLLPEGE